MSEGNALDWSRALEMADGDAELLVDLASQFVANAPQLLGALREAVNAKSPDQLAHAAHRLRGSLGIFQAMRAFHEVGALEHRARERKLEDDPSRAVETIEEMVETVRQELAVRVAAARR